MGCGWTDSGKDLRTVCRNGAALLREIIKWAKWNSSGGYGGRHKACSLCSTALYGGERGIRTPDTVSRIHAFQACAFSHSAISPDAVWLRGVGSIENFSVRLKGAGVVEAESVCRMFFSGF